MRWPSIWHRSSHGAGRPGAPGASGAAGAGAPGTSGATPGGASSAADAVGNRWTPVARPAWRDLPPLKRTAGELSLTAATPGFTARLAGRRPPPPILRPLGHDVTADGPAGLVSGLAAPLTTTAPATGVPAAAVSLPAGELPLAVEHAARSDAAGGRGRGPEPEDTAAQLDAVSVPARQLPVASGEARIAHAYTVASVDAALLPTGFAERRHQDEQAAHGHVEPAAIQSPTPGAVAAAPTGSSRGAEGAVEVDAVPPASSHLTLGQSRRLGLGSPMGRVPATAVQPGDVPGALPFDPRARQAARAGAATQPEAAASAAGAAARDAGAAGRLAAVRGGAAKPLPALQVAVQRSAADGAASAATARSASTGPSTDAPMPARVRPLVGGTGAEPSARAAGGASAAGSASELQLSPAGLHDDQLLTTIGLAEGAAAATPGLPFQGEPASRATEASTWAPSSPAPASFGSAPYERVDAAPIVQRARHARASIGLSSGQARTVGARQAETQPRSLGSAGLTAQRAPRPEGASAAAGGANAGTATSRLALAAHAAPAGPARGTAASIQLAAATTPVAPEARQHDMPGTGGFAASQGRLTWSSPLPVQRSVVIDEVSAAPDAGGVGPAAAASSSAAGADAAGAEAAGATPTTGPVAAAAGAGSDAGQQPMTDQQLDLLARRIYGRIRDRLGMELLLDRERVGQLADL